MTTPRTHPDATLAGDLPGLRLEPLRRYLAARVPGFSPVRPLVPSLLARGRSNITYLVEQSDARCVVRRPPLGHVMESAHDVLREHRITSALSQVGYPVPRPLAGCSDTSLIGAPFIVSAYVEGEVIDGSEPPQWLTPQPARAELSRNFMTALARLHRLPVTEQPLAALGRPTGYVARQVRRWSQQWETTRTRHIPDMDDLRRWLQSAVARFDDAGAAAVVHGDYRLDNLIMDRSSLTARAVVDWEMATLGHPLTDVAVALVYWIDPADSTRLEIPVGSLMTRQPGFASRGELLQSYLEVNPLDVEHLDVHLVLACFKLAIIMESIVARTRLGQQVGLAVEEEEAMAGSAPALARLGLAVAGGAGLSGLSG